MTYRFGKRSARLLSQAHPDLQRVVKKLMDYQLFDFSVICSHRSEAEQLKKYQEGKSQVKKGKHNFMPSLAVDVLPYPSKINGVNVWQDKQRFCVLAGAMMVAAKEEGVAIRWGGDWDGDGNNADSKFWDAPHFELQS